MAFVANADPDDDIFWETNNFLPVNAFEITPHAAVTVNSNDIFEILDDVERIRMVEEGVGHWMGLIPDPEGGARGRRVPSTQDRRIAD